MDTAAFTGRVRAVQQRVEQALTHVLGTADAAAARLHAAMSYSVLNGGKRLLLGRYDIASGAFAETALTPAFRALLTFHDIGAAIASGCSL